MYQRSSEILDYIFFDEMSKEWMADGINIQPALIDDVYRQFLYQPSGQIRTVEEVWQSISHSIYDNSKRLIFALAVKQPGIHPMIAAFYLLALKHKCLHMFQCVDGLSEYAIEDLLPFDVRLIFIDIMQIVEFYNKYGTRAKSSKFSNKIRLPDTFNKT